MKHIKFLILLISISVALGACKKQLDVRNPNAPTPESANTELGIVSLAQGSKPVYLVNVTKLRPDTTN